jgi:predicted AAA+ superfamily ATPase
MYMIIRKAYLESIKEAFKVHPVVALLGPRQCGKTTLARAIFKDGPSSHYFDLEDPTHEMRIQNPKSALSSLEGLIVIDEVQRAPELFKYLRVLVDRPDKKAKVLILGSASRNLIKQSSESLAGRIQYIEVAPFSYQEVGAQNKRDLWLKGGFPLSYLAETEKHSRMWRDAYIKTYLEQDIPNLGITIPAQQLRKFWYMLAHYHGQIFNASEIAGSLGITAPTVKKYLDILSGTFMVRQLQPWHANIKKRQIKSPKIYMRDSGIYHRLLQTASDEDILINPKLGASWEGFAMEQIIQKKGVDSSDCYFWGVHGQAELDLLVVKNGKKVGYEFKYSDQPKVTKSMQKAIDTLGLDGFSVVYPGDTDFELSDGIQAVSL